jgi:hypothetical protein
VALPAPLRKHPKKTKACSMVAGLKPWMATGLLSFEKFLYE